MGTEAKQIFDTDHLVRSYFKLSIPITCSLMVSMIYSIADTYFIAQTGNEALVAGVSLCYPLFFITMGIGNVFGQGGSTLMARCLGENNIDAVRRVTSFCFYITLIVGAAAGIFLAVFSRPVLTLFGATSETYSHAYDYYIVMAFAAPVSAASFIHSNLLRCEGYAKESMIANIIASVTNIVLDPIFIFGFGLGATGAAIATVIGVGLGDLICLSIVLRKKTYVCVDIRRMRVSGKEIKEILGVGASAALLNLMESLCILLVNQFLLPYGTLKVAAMGIGKRVAKVPFMVLTGMTFGGVPLLGYLYGSGNYKKLLELMRFCFKMIIWFTVIATVVMCVSAPFLMPLFMDKGTIVADGTLMIRWQIMGALPFGIMLMIMILCQAIGKAKQALVLSMSHQGVVFIAVLIVANLIAGYMGVVLSQFIADVISFIIAFAIYRNISKELKKT